MSEQNGRAIERETCVGCHSNGAADGSKYCEDCRDNLVSSGWPWGQR